MLSLRELRSQRLMSQLDLATATGLASKTIIRLEKNRNTPNFLSMRRICNALGVEPKDVTEFAEAMARRGKTE